MGVVVAFVGVDHAESPAWAYLTIPWLVATAVTTRPLGLVGIDHPKNLAKPACVEIVRVTAYNAPSDPAKML